MHQRRVGVATLSVLASLALPARGGDAHADAAGAQAVAQPASPLIGDWELDLARTHYGAGVDRRRRERFTCVGRGTRVACTIRGERTDGRVVTGSFTATPGGTASPVVGIAGIDSVRLHLATDSVIDAFFSARGRPVFGYRAYRSDDRRTLVIVPVDPTSRAALTTVVVYRHR